MLRHITSHHNVYLVSTRTNVVLDSFVDEHGCHVFQLRADSEHIAESARRDTQHTPTLSVEWRKTAKLTVSLARLARVQVVTCLQHARIVSGRRRLRCRRRRSVSQALLALCTDTTVVILSFRCYSLKRHFNNQN